MLSAFVVKGVDIAGHSSPSFCTGGESVPVDQFFFDGRMEGFDAGIIVGIAFSAHADLDLVFFEKIGVES